MSPSSFRLIVRTGPNPGMVFDLTKEVIMVGRDVTNEVVLGDAEVSRQHARLTRTPGGYVLEDLGSTNGTFVNGERLMAPRVLNPGDLVGMGETVTMTFDAVSPEAAATVAREAAAPAPAVQPAPAPQPVAPHAVAAAPAAPPVAPAVAPAEPRKTRVPLVVAGGGCLLLVLICGGILWFMPLEWWCVLLTPLRFLGFNFPGC
ncbi:MAG: FHA domain-containing protein [Anaerolineales bacterium]|nr:FHA domain-containing protein [Anaerolineales bacterium]